MIFIIKLLASIAFVLYAVKWIAVNIIGLQWSTGITYLVGGLSLFIIVMSIFEHFTSEGEQR